MVLPVINFFEARGLLSEIENTVLPETSEKE